MAERKVLIRYYPPDFDPEKLRAKAREQKRRQPGGRQRGAASRGSKVMNVRFMFPFTMCCGACKEFIYIGTKFNSRVERVVGEDYLGLPIWRFYARCPHCRGNITFKTDPKNTEYILESGGSRTSDPTKDRELAEAAAREELEQDLAGDAMLALEHKRYTTATELDAINRLDALRRINKRLLHPEAAADAALEWLRAGGLEGAASPADAAAAAGAAAAGGAGEGAAPPAGDEFTKEELEELRAARRAMEKKRLAQLFPESGEEGERDDG